MITAFEVNDQLHRSVLNERNRAMRVGNHSEDFEKEFLINELFSKVSELYPSFYFWTDFRTLIELLNPALYEGAFTVRACCRTLRYTGHSWLAEPERTQRDEKSRFEVGAIYRSVDFNGATYGIEGHGPRRIGWVYFECMKEE
jgi:hypothetical protein